MQPELLFTLDNVMSNILKKQVIKDVYSRSGCLFLTKASEKFNNAVSLLVAGKTYHYVAKSSKLGWAFMV